MSNIKKKQNSKEIKKTKVETKKTDNNKNKVKLIWINNEEKLFPKVLEEKCPNRFNITYPKDLKEGFEEIKTIKFQQCYVIVRGRYFQDFIEIMKEEGKYLKCVPNVFILTSDRFKNDLNNRVININDKYTKKETLNYVDDGFYNKGGVFSGVKAMTEKISKIDKENNINLNNSEAYENNKTSNKDSNQKMFTFQIKSKEDLIIPSVCNQFLSYNENDNKKIKDFLNDLMKKDYKEKEENVVIVNVNDLIKPLINLLDVKNFPEQILIKYLVYIYSLNTGFYKDMNKYLSTEGKQGIYEVFISLMYRGLYLNVFAKNQDYKTLYRAQLMNKEEVSRIKNLFEKKIDSLPAEIIYSNCFLSFTYKKEVYHFFFKDIKKDKKDKKDKNEELINILFIIENGGDLDFTHHADLEGLSKYYNTEFEILFFPFSSFTIENIEENCNDYISKKKNKQEIKENIVVTKIYLKYLGKYKDIIKNEIKTININEFMLNLKDNDFYKQVKKFNVTEKFNKDIAKTEAILENLIKNTVETIQSTIINEEYINELRITLLSNVILLKSKKLIQNNNDNFYAYSDKTNNIFSLIIKNKDSNEKIKDSKLNNDDIVISDEYSNSMINYIYELNDGRILLCCFDNQIKIITKNYFYKKFYFEQRLKNHKSLITNVIELNNGKLCSCSFDGTIKLWKKNDTNHYSQDDNLFIDTELLFYTIIEVNNNIVSLLKNYKNEKKYLLIYSIVDKKANFININEIELYNKNLINLDNETFAFGGTNKIYVFNLKGEKIKELNLKFSVICLYKLIDNRFIVSNNDGKLFLATDFNSIKSFNQIKYSENMDKKIISIEEFKDNTIITRSKSMIHIWKIK